MRKVLIVDDEAIARKGLRRAVSWEKLGYTVAAEAANGKTALELADEGGFDMIFTDITMPVMDGIELIRRLEERRYPAKVVILSCHEDFDYAREALRMGAVDYLLKHTFTPEDVHALLGKLDDLFRSEDIREEFAESHQRDMLTRFMLGKVGEEELEHLRGTGVLPAGPAPLSILVLRVPSAEDPADLDRQVGRILAGREAPPVRRLRSLKPYPGTYALVLEYLPQGGEEEMRGAMRGLCGDLQTKLSEDGLSVLLSKSDLHRGWDHLPAAFEEGLEGLERSMDFDECNTKVKLAIEYIKANYARPIALSDIAEHVCISRIYLSQLFKKETGMNISRYILEYRIDVAKRLLLDSNLKIYAIADMVGFGSAQYFSRLFRRVTGMNPIDYKEQAGKAEAAL